MRRGCASKLFVALALTGLGAGAAAAQSFDCAKAASANEKLICSDAALGRLDLELEAAVRRALEAAPAERERLLGDERRWVKQRDRDCAREGASARDENIECLTKAYGERIAGLAKAAERLPHDDTLCRRLVELYRSVAATHPEATRDSHSGRDAYSANPFEALLTDKAPGVSRASTSGVFEDGTPDKIAAWARSQRPPFVVSDDLMKTLSQGGGDTLFIDRLPGSDVYAAYRIEGTMHCTYADYFVVRDGRTISAAAPPGWADEDGSNCGVDRFFATIDGRSVAVEGGGGDYSPAFGVGYSIAPWLADHFGPACNVAFEFVPVFALRVDSANPSADSDACVGSDCDKQRQAALALAEAVQQSPRNASQAAMAQLTQPQRRQYAALMKDFPLAKTADAGAVIPSDLLESAPLVVPALRDGKVCRALVGHTTLGWRTWADWRVKLECRDNGALTGPSFVIGMGRGRLVSATVK